jgi:hypothetical protein
MTGSSLVARRSNKSSDGPAIERFCNLLEQRKCSYWLEKELHEVLPPRRTKPDFFVRTANHASVLVEVESFKKDRFTLKALRQNPVMSGLADSDNRRFLTALQHACNQLKPYRDLQFPSLVVLDDFRCVGMPVNVDILGMCLLGYFDQNSARHHVSAVAWLLGGQDVPFYLRVFHNPYANYPMLPNIFASQSDEHLRVLPGKFWEKFD